MFLTFYLLILYWYLLQINTKLLNNTPNTAHIPQTPDESRIYNQDGCSYNRECYMERYSTHPVGGSTEMRYMYLDTEFVTLFTSVGHNYRLTVYNIAFRISGFKVLSTSVLYGCSNVLTRLRSFLRIGTSPTDTDGGGLSPSVLGT